MPFNNCDTVSNNREINVGDILKPNEWVLKQSLMDKGYEFRAHYNEKHQFDGFMRIK